MGDMHLRSVRSLCVLFVFVYSFLSARLLASVFADSRPGARLSGRQVE